MLCRITLHYCELDANVAVMKLSVIVIAYNMAREIPRTLQGLARSYQQDALSLDYEVILVDNGSTVPLDPSTWSHVDVPVTLIHIRNASHSPAHAINVALDAACGEIICLMIDGAHLLTPGVFRLALGGIGMFGQALIATRYFWLGPDEQNASIHRGYSQPVEDELLHHINWPEDGYRLYEIGVALTAGAEKITWFNRMFESNCLFMTRAMFDAIGGADERFVLPGGGMINSDIYKRASDLPGVTPVQLIGEGSFHQLHGGTTTNVTPQERDARVERFMEEYRDITGQGELMSDKPYHYIGHLPTEASKIHRQGRPDFTAAMRRVGL
ncbi:MAG: glycosyltransferase [Halioglobus sp.]|nr:glycosyltransferase [Halioglobus sp.]